MHEVQLVIQVDTPARRGAVERVEETVYLDGRFRELKGEDLLCEVRDLLRHLPALISRQGYVWDGQAVKLDALSARSFVATIGVKPRAVAPVG